MCVNWSFLGKLYGSKKAVAAKEKLTKKNVKPESVGGKAMDHKPMTGISYEGDWYDTVEGEDIEYLLDGTYRIMKGWECEDTDSGLVNKPRAIVDCDILISLCSEVMMWRRADKFLSESKEKFNEEFKDDVSTG